MGDCLYSVLGLSKTATMDQINKAFRAKSRDCHPDNTASTPDSECKKLTEKFKKLKHAHKILSDPISRYKYDSPSSEDDEGPSEVYSSGRSAQRSLSPSSNPPSPTQSRRLDRSSRPRSYSEYLDQSDEERPGHGRQPCKSSGPSEHEGLFDQLKSARAPRGWYGFGFGPPGDMFGSDFGSPGSMPFMGGFDISFDSNNPHLSQGMPDFMCGFQESSRRPRREPPNFIRQFEESRKRGPGERLNFMHGMEDSDRRAGRGSSGLSQFDRGLSPMNMGFREAREGKPLRMRRGNDDLLF
ncbi:DnaJ-domain-containing protein [Corynespora cassiicola Philippines]|uniref:DnaJ-domain-containing protein n=1 Tax=Corynespora cassiicola Philippines TaxID=1448308 RepID=A0A2T2NTL2_CORCC|nr:DnaJ-domain-containing protein [Corynespora cassiicola Philippines]